LPEKNTLVLLYLQNGEESTTTTGKIYKSPDASLDKLDGEFCVGFEPFEPDFLRREVVTHWMPLPSTEGLKK